MITYTNTAEIAEVEKILQLSIEKEFFTRFIQKNTSRVIYCYQNDLLVGLGVYWKNPYHPQAIYFKMTVNFQISNRVEIYQALFHEIQTQAFQRFGESSLQFSCWATQRDLTDFASRNDFQSFRITFFSSCELEFIQEIDVELDETAEILTLNELKENPTLLANLLVDLEENYEESHRENPLKEMGQEEWISVIFADDPLLDVPCVLLKNGQIKAFCICFEESEKKVELAWDGCLDEDYLSLNQLICLLSHELYMKEYTFLEGEFDTTSKSAMYLLATFPFNPTPSLVSFLKK